MTMLTVRDSDYARLSNERRLRWVRWLASGSAWTYEPNQRHNEVVIFDPSDSSATYPPSSSSSLRVARENAVTVPPFETPTIT